MGAWAQAQAIRSTFNGLRSMGATIDHIVATRSHPMGYRPTDRPPTDRPQTDRPQTIGHSKTPKSMKETRPFGNGSVITIPFRRGGRLREMLYNPINHTISTRHFSAQKTTSKCRTSTQIDVTVLVQNYIHKVLSINLLKANYNPDMKVLN